MQTALTTMLGVEHPIILAPMAGGPSTPALAAAVSNAGGLGMLGAAYLSPDMLRREIGEVRQLTYRPFGVNLFVPETPAISPESLARAQTLLGPYRVELGIPPSPSVTRYAESFDDQLAVLLDERVPVFSFTFGVVPAERIRALHDAGIRVVGTATTVAEGRTLERAGVDAIVAQGSEAGGHRGTFDTDPTRTARSLIGGMALIPQLVDAVRVPIIAAGGIMNGRGVIAALALGAAAAQMGTAFLACPESGANAAHRVAILASADDATVITRAFSGRPARGLANRLTEELRPHEAELPPFPALNALTRDIRQAAARQGRAEYLSLWAGQAAPLATTRPAADIVRDTMTQAHGLLAQLANARPANS